MHPFDYIRPATPQDAVAAFANAEAGARYIAGGTTLYDLMKLDIERPPLLIDVTAIAGLGEVDIGDERLRVGALVPMSTIAADPDIGRDYPVLAESLAKAASQQLRNMATVGGNLLQRTRCMYFRNGADGAFPCNKRQPGSGCAAIDGLDRGQAVLGTSASCTAVSPGDWPVALTALDASVEIVGPAGARRMLVADLYRLPGDTPHLEFSLTPGELITGIEIPRPAAGSGSTYHKIRDRESYAFALASAAVVVQRDGDLVSRARIALGGVATRPWRATEAEDLLVGQPLTIETALAAGRAAFSTATPGHHNGFKLELGARTVADALLIAAERSRT
ncbi:FAD binding domain-containing protein [Methylobrevis albus]|uniref:Xanthine dehydrogenase family protein subunit M n=1 Tax=Methylobrevis albus TaxID=2793297 RepID=A0A931I222_9HYPH|nr:xanthine dehydrogenase family protein subunit M [Methylobrevis albus]MBH0238009.1 xanthine dehydrogenase family protein subunit M [Methylobrevis albus]